MDDPAGYPPLLGDSEGRYKIHVVGNSGAGKSTTGAKLASILRVPYISLDHLFWNPGWRQTPPEEFKERIKSKLSEHANKGWVIDGSYSRVIGDMVTNESTDVVWLDPPLLLYFPRLILRTILRLLRLRPQCSNGCNESMREAFFSRDGILVWCLTQHWHVRRRLGAQMKLFGLGVGSNIEGQKMRRFGGWGSDLACWLDQVRQIAKSS